MSIDGEKIKAESHASLPLISAWNLEEEIRAIFGCWPNGQDSGQVPNFSSFPRVCETAGISLQIPASNQAHWAASRPPSLPAVALSGIEMWPLWLSSD